jgi:hypothetical protein
MSVLTTTTRTHIPGEDILSLGLFQCLGELGLRTGLNVEEINHGKQSGIFLVGLKKEKDNGQSRRC